MVPRTSVPGGPFPGHGEEFGGLFSGEWVYLFREGVDLPTNSLLLYLHTDRTLFQLSQALKRSISCGPDAVLSFVGPKTSERVRSTSSRPGSLNMGMWIMMLMRLATSNASWMARAYSMTARPLSS